MNSFIELIIYGYPYINRHTVAHKARNFRSYRSKNKSSLSVWEVSEFGIQCSGCTRLKRDLYKENRQRRHRQRQQDPFLDWWALMKETPHAASVCKCHSFICKQRKIRFVSIARSLTFFLFLSVWLSILLWMLCMCMYMLCTWVEHSEQPSFFKYSYILLLFFFAQR